MIMVIDLLEKPHRRGWIRLDQEEQEIEVPPGIVGIDLGHPNEDVVIVVPVLPNDGINTILLIGDPLDIENLHDNISRFEYP